MDYQVKIRRQNGNEEEYIVHHGVKGMKWGVRRAKALGKATVNGFVHPIKSTSAAMAMDRRDGMLKAIRRNAIGRSTRELEELNNIVSGKKVAVRSNNKKSKNNKAERVTKAANKTVSKGKKSSGEKQLDAISAKYNSHMDQSDKLRKAASIARKSGNSEKAAELEKKAKSYRNRAERLFS